jgi:nitrate/TMAO reductase-like tetraheme cytochrome c subunit
VSKTSKPSTNRRLTAIPFFVGAIVVLALLAAGGFGFAASQETHDAFCASCHTQPETAFFQNSTAAQPVDLASYHTGQQTLCINCHSGQGLSGRVQAELMGARNAVKWYTGTAVQPAPLTYPISDQNCLKCHQDVIARGFTPKQQIALSGIGGGGREGGERSNHWHQNLARWQAASTTAGGCVSCHSGHATGTTAQAGFMNAQNVRATCDACHQVLRRGEDG